MTTLRFRLPLALLLASLLAFGAAACGDDDDDNGSATSIADGITEVTRQIFTTGQPDEAPGEDLVLSRVIIPAGAELAAHTHPGMQMAVIIEGVLTYTVHEGEARLTRNAAAADATAEPVPAGTTIEIGPGDALLEPEGMVHSAKNAGDVPIVIYLASLFEEGAPASSPAN